MTNQLEAAKRAYDDYCVDSLTKKYAPRATFMAGWEAAARHLCLAAPVAEAKHRVEQLEHSYREAQNYCEGPIALRTKFDGNPPYVGWKGLGLAMEQAFDERDMLREQLAAVTAERDILRTRLQAQVEATVAYAKTFDAEIRRHFEHHGLTLPKIDGPLWQAVQQFCTRVRSDCEQAEAALAEARDVIHGYLRACGALAGEHFYHKALEILERAKAGEP